jgi:hypothetical protein
MIPNLPWLEKNIASGPMSRLLPIATAPYLKIKRSRITATDEQKLTDGKFWGLCLTLWLSNGQSRALCHFEGGI